MNLNQLEIGNIHTLRQNNLSRITGGGITNRQITRINQEQFVFLTNSAGRKESQRPPQSIEKWSNCAWIKII